MSHILLDVKFIAFTLLLQVPNKLMDSLCHESANMWLAACFCKEGIGKQKCLFSYVLSMTAFVLQWDIWIVGDRNCMYASRKYSISDLLRKYLLTIINIWIFESMNYYLRSIFFFLSVQIIYLKHFTIYLKPLTVLVAKSMLADVHYLLINSGACWAVYSSFSFFLLILFYF